MRLSKLLAAAKIPYGGADREIERVVCDSRAAGKRTLFVCIRGFASDGHNFAARAYAAGCRTFLCEQAVDLPADALVICAENTRIALAKVSAAFFDYPAEKLQVIGITGTKGKTTSALMLCSILNRGGVPAGYIGSNGIDFAGRHFETKNTTPESLELHYYFDQMVRAGIRAVVLEVSSQALYLNRVYGIRFAAVAFTNLAPDHIGEMEHPTFEHYRDSKKQLFSAYSSDYAVYNAEDGAAAYMLDGCRALRSSFGLETGDFHAEGIEPFLSDGELGVRFTLCHFSKRVPVRLCMPGTFSVYNALCAAALAQRFGVSLSDCAGALGAAHVQGRFEVVRTRMPAVFIIDYAHNGFSLSQALATLRAYRPARLICVLGSVGGRTEGRRAELGAALSEACDLAVLTADNPDFEDPLKICAEIRAAFVRDIACQIFARREDAIAFAVREARRGDIVLFAGKGHEQYQLIRGGKHPFSERKLIEKYAMEAAAELVQ